MQTPKLLSFNWPRPLPWSSQWNMNTWKGLNSVSDPLIQTLFRIRLIDLLFSWTTKQSSQIRVERKPFIAGGWGVWPDESEPRRCAARFWFSGRTPTPGYEYLIQTQPLQDTCAYPKSKHLWGQRYDQSHSSEFTLALNLDILDAGRSPNAVTPELHRSISKLTACHLQISPPGDLLITIVKELGHYEGLSRCRLVGSCVLPGEDFFT